MLLPGTRFPYFSRSPALRSSPRRKEGNLKNCQGCENSLLGQVAAAPPRAAPVEAALLARAQDLFRSLDRNGDGVVSRTECGESARTPRRQRAMEGGRKVRDKLLGRK